MRRTWTIIGVGDVPRSFKWYQSLFGLPATAPAHDDFGQILDSDGTVLLCLHEWGVHEHPPLMSPGQAQPGNGLLLFFRVDDFAMTLPRARVGTSSRRSTASSSCIRSSRPTPTARSAGTGSSLIISRATRASRRSSLRSRDR